MPTLNNHGVGTLDTTVPITLGRLTPRADGHAALTGTAFATTVRVIDRVHRGTANSRSNATPTICTRLTDLAQAMLFVANFTNVLWTAGP